MRPEAQERRLHSPSRPAPREQASAPDHADPRPERGCPPQAAAAIGRQGRAAVEERRRTPPLERQWSLRRSSAKWQARRRLGPLEYLLLALIVLGVAITIAMFIVEPSG